jgi:methyl-accepting chemotaxis protein
LRIGIGKKIGFGFVLQVVLVLAGGVLNVYQFQKADALVQVSKEVRGPMEQAGLKIIAAANGARAAAIGELLYGSDPQAFNQYRNERLKHMEAARTQTKAMGAIAAKLDDPATKSKVEQLTAKTERLGELHEQGEKLIASGGAGLGQAFDLEQKESSVEALSVADDANSFVREQQKMMEEEDADVRSSMQMAKAGTLLTLILAVVFGVIIGRAVSLRITHSLDQVVTRASAIADGDMSGQKLESLGDDEIADLSAAMNRMQDGLSEMIHSVMASSDQVSSAAEEISANATQSAHASADQRRQTEQVKSAMDEMTAAVHAVSENSRRAAEQSQEAARKAKSGGEVVRQTVSTMEQISSETMGVAAQIDQLGHRSEEIGRIAGVIDDIADQTNLLALNAAIEAARAGEQGRGFAVVADEVRKLAERTASATKEISAMITTIQTETKNAVSAIKDGSDRVNTGVTTAVDAGKSLEEIIAAAERVGDMVGEITMAAEQQSQTTSQVQENVAQINRLVHESATGTQESAHACESLSALALELQRSTTRFKLDSRAKQNYGVQTEYPQAEPDMFGNYVN